MEKTVRSEEHRLSDYIKCEEKGYNRLLKRIIKADIKKQYKRRWGNVNIKKQTETTLCIMCNEKDETFFLHILSECSNLIIENIERDMPKLHKLNTGIFVRSMNYDTQEIGTILVEKVAEDKNAKIL